MPSRPLEYRTGDVQNGTKRSALRSGLAGLLGSLVALGCGADAPAPGRPDIVLVSIDSLRADHLGCYGYERDTSPILDRLANEGSRFAHALSTTSWTLPAHASLFTGLLDQTHGVVLDAHPLADAHVTLAEVLRDAGYQTAGFYGGPYLHPTFGMGQGFEVYESSADIGWERLDGARFQERMADRELDAHRDVTGPRTVEAVSRWLENVDASPFFLFLHLWDVHFDYMPPERYVELFDPDYAGDLDASNLHSNPAIHAGMDPRDLEHLIALYDGEIRFTDDVLGRILALLERAGRYENMLLVVTADHGEEFFEHGRKHHRKTLYDEVLRVPLIVRWPERIEAGRVVEEQVQITDVFPTVLSLAGVPLPVPVQGRDLSPLLDGEPLEPAPALAELAGRLTALRTNDVKLVRFEDQVAEFHLDVDPGELSPVEAGPEARERLRRHVARAKAFREALGARARRPEQRAIPPEVRERLRDLGYLDAAPSDPER